MREIVFGYKEGWLLAWDIDGNLLARWSCEPGFALLADLFNQNQHIGRMLVNAFNGLPA